MYIPIVFKIVKYMCEKVWENFQTICIIGSVLIIGTQEYIGRYMVD